MRVLYAHPTGETGTRACVAFVDIELSEDIRLYGLRLVRQPDGRHLLYAPTCGRRLAATFSKPMAQRLTAMALDALGAAR